MTTIQQIQEHKEVMNNKIKEAIIELCNKCGTAKMEFTIKVVYEYMDSEQRFINVQVKSEMTL